MTWTYLVSNTGNRPLTDIVLTDDQEGAITCPQTTLAVDEHMVCTVTGTAVAGTYVNIASVTAAGPGPSGPTTVGDQDASSYVATNPEVPGELPTTGAPTQSVVLLAVAMIAAGLGVDPNPPLPRSARALGRVVERPPRPGREREPPKHGIRNP